MKQRAVILVSGRVQGVFYRASAVREAQRFGLSGYARNLMSGQVEIVCEGARKPISEMLKWCRKGPPLAHVDEMEVSYSNATGEFDSFNMK